MAEQYREILFQENQYVLLEDGKKLGLFPEMISGASFNETLIGARERFIEQRFIRRLTEQFNDYINHAKSRDPAWIHRFFQTRTSIFDIMLSNAITDEQLQCTPPQGQRIISAAVRRRVKDRIENLLTASISASQPLNLHDEITQQRAISKIPILLDEFIEWAAESTQRRSVFSDKRFKNIKITLNPLLLQVLYPDDKAIVLAATLLSAYIQKRLHLINIFQEETVTDYAAYRKALIQRQRDHLNKGLIELGRESEVVRVTWPSCETRDPLKVLMARYGQVALPPMVLRALQYALAGAGLWAYNHPFNEALGAQIQKDQPLVLRFKDGMLNSLSAVTYFYAGQGEGKKHIGTVTTQIVCDGARPRLLQHYRVEAIEHSMRGSLALDKRPVYALTRNERKGAPSLGRSLLKGLMQGLLTMAIGAYIPIMLALFFPPFWGLALGTLLVSSLWGIGVGGYKTLSDYRRAKKRAALAKAISDIEEVVGQEPHQQVLRTPIHVSDGRNSETMKAYQVDALQEGVSVSRVSYHPANR